MTCEHKRQEKLPCATPDCADGVPNNFPYAYTAVPPEPRSAGFYSPPDLSTARFKQQRWVRTSTDIGWLWMRDGDPT